MKIVINGEQREFEPPLSVSGLAERLALDPRKVAVERNLSIVPKSAFSEKNP